MNKSTTNNWEQVTVIAGEPCLARISLNELIENKDRVIRFYKGDDISSLKNSLTNCSMTKPKIILYDPNAEILNICLAIIESGKLMAKSLIVMVTGDSIDGRWSFYSKSQKNKRTLNYPYVEMGNQQMLLKFLSGWQTDSGIEIDGDGKKWLVSNAPVVCVKLKSNTKKEVEVYDLEAIEAELIKLLAYCKYTKTNLTVKHLKNFCNFTQTNDIWNFVKAAVTGDVRTSLTLMEDIRIEHGLNTVLWLLNSQLAFLVQIKDLMSRRYDSDGIVSQMNFDKYFGKYLNEQWEEIEKPNSPSINPWRVKRGMDTVRNPYCTTERLRNQQRSICSAIIDSRSGMPEDIIMTFLVLSMCGIMPVYPESHLIV